MNVYVICAGDVGEPGDKGPVGKAIEGPVGDQGEPGECMSVTPAEHLLFSKC